MADRHYLVLGGTKGTGRFLAQTLSKQPQSQVSVFGRSGGEIADAPNATLVSVDVTDPGALITAIDAAVSARGKLESVVFLQRHRGDEGEFDLHLAVGPGAMRAVIEHIVARDLFAGSGAKSFVVVSSIADTYVAPEQASGYHAAKAAMVQLARYYALRLGPKGIRVNCVSPCVVLKPEAKSYYAEHSKLKEKLDSTIPLGRMGAPQDIVNAILFLAGDQAAYITGQNLVVDGGLTLRSHESLIREDAEKA